MRFFNPKEEVIDLQLTQHGKRLVSVGKFDPVYYGFYDGDIVYNVSYASGSEKQNEAKGRIIYDTPRLRTQYTYTSVESDKKKDLKKVPSPTHENHYFGDSCLGNASLTNQHTPAWSAGLLKGEFTRTEHTITGSAPNVKIPQLYASVKYKTFSLSEFVPYDMEKPSPTGGDTSFVDERLAGRLEFEDGSRIVVEKDHILLSLEELNVDFKNENFEIEVYEVLDEPAIDSVGEQVDGNPKKERLQPLYFDKDPMSVYGMGSAGGSAWDDEISSVDPSYVEHYFEILIDREIDPEEMCQYKNSIKGKAFLDRGFECPDEEEGDEIRVDYGRGILEEPETPPEECE
jgi:hypothetical protein